MKKIGFLIIIAFAFCFSCKNEKTQTTNKPVSETIKDSIKEEPVSLITIRRAKHSTSEAGKPSATNAKAPSVYQTNMNVNLVGDLKSSEVPADLYSTTPGEDKLQLPIVVTAKINSVVCVQSIPVPATAPRFKDAAISNIQYLDVEQGLSSSFIRSLLFDKWGNLWMGTVGGGASRYDGSSFTNFTEKNGLSNNTVLCMIQDKLGRIWFGTEGGGACCYDGKVMWRFTKDEGLTDNTILSLFEDKDGKIWMGTNGAGINVYDGKTIKVYDESMGLNNNTVRTITQDSKGTMWFGTNGWGACQFNGKSFTYFGTGAGLNSKIVHSIIEDNDGNVWFATDDGGVNIYDGKTIRYLMKEDGLSSDCVISLHKDKKGNILMGTYDGGLCVYDGEKVEVFSTRQGLSNNYVLCIREDATGNVWMGTYGGGVCLYNGSSFIHYTEREGLGSNTVRSIVQDADSNIWFGTYGDGVIQYNGRTFSHYTESEGLSSNYVKALTLDKSGNVWMGTDGGGAVRFNGKTFENFGEDQGLSSNYILSLFTDRSGKVWFGTDGAGVCCYNGTVVTKFMDDPVLTENSVVAITQDKLGNLWFGTDGYGAVCYDGEFFRCYSEKEGLCSDYVKSIVIDTEGNVWIGTDGRGVSVLKANSIKTRRPEFLHFDENDGLSSKNIRSMVQDKIGNVWIATEKGLNYLVNRNGKFTNYVYTTANGLKANNFFPNSVYVDGENRIWWGNGKALTTLALNDYKLSDKAPDIHLSSMELEQTFIDFNALEDSLETGRKIQVGDKVKKNLSNVSFNGLTDFYNYPKDLVLPHYINHLTFHFSGIEWSAPDKIQYQYMLEGSDDNDWSPLTSENKASFSNLSHGDYTFKVKAKGNSQKWSEPFEYKFSIRAPWYLHPGAYAGYLIGFISIVFGFNGIRTRQLKVRQQQLEVTVAERTSEVVQQKELIEQKQKEIVDSINYAKRIQGAMLASDQLFDSHLKNYFLFFQPKDIVSGDFYWASPMPNGNFVLVTADSTGHGVPGAMMSMLNISCLNEAVSERKLTDPAEILNHARQRIISSLSQDGSLEGGKDGMDCSVLVFDFKKKKMHYSGANNPVWIVRAEELIELKADRMPVGKHDKDSVSFTSHVVDLQDGDMIFALTDGVPDQFGGPKGKKFTYRKLKELLTSNSSKSMTEQKQALQKAVDVWKRELDQVDDMLLVGVQL
ncbi:MAG: SpoIIE family protein phosphatase [Sphingobacteriaceae bacterium]|nr:SpoIIE family protein phosphatase [Sphingobacteriaceae bacterium]